jgi:hypothetical protein
LVLVLRQLSEDECDQDHQVDEYSEGKTLEKGLDIGPQHEITLLSIMEKPAGNWKFPSGLSGWYG